MGMCSASMLVCWQSQVRSMYSRDIENPKLWMQTTYLTRTIKLWIKLDTPVSTCKNEVFWLCASNFLWDVYVSMCHSHCSCLRTFNSKSIWSLKHWLTNMYKLCSFFSFNRESTVTHSDQYFGLTNSFLNSWQLSYLVKYSKILYFTVHSTIATVNTVTFFFVWINITLKISTQTPTRRLYSTRHLLMCSVHILWATKEIANLAVSDLCMSEDKHFTIDIIFGKRTSMIGISWKKWSLLELGMETEINNCTKTSLVPPKRAYLIKYIYFSKEFD